MNVGDGGGSDKGSAVMGGGGGACVISGRVSERDYCRIPGVIRDLWEDLSYSFPLCICIVIYTLYTCILAFNNLLFLTYFFSFWKLLRIAFEVLLLTLSSWQQSALQGDTLCMGVIQIHCIWGTSIVNRQCWNF